MRVAARAPLRVVAVILAIAALLVPSSLALANGEQDVNSTAIAQPQTTVSAAGATNGADQVNYFWSGALLTVDVTVITGTTPTLTVKAQEKDTLSGKYVDIPNCTTAAINSVSTVALECYPGIAVAANVAASVSVPKNWRVVSTAGGTPTTITWTVGVQYLK